jgi:hypothetical protein
LYQSHSHLFSILAQRLPSWVKAQLQLVNPITTVKSRAAFGVRAFFYAFPSDFPERGRLRMQARKLAGV